ncbi:CoA transferase, partial [Marinobacter pelagius]|uniref:CoA transferase n=1 Tax=Marinobacter sp. C7 TaxID=2951363 RepID=UPI001EEFB79B
RFADNSARVANRAALDAIIEAVFVELSRASIVGRLDRARIAYGRISSLQDLAGHPQNRYVEVETPSGPVRMLAPGAVVDGQTTTLGAVPALGAHTAKIVSEFAEVAPVE